MMALSNAGIIQNTTTTTIFGSGSTPPTHSHTENISRSGDLLTLIRHSDTFAYTPTTSLFLFPNRSVIHVGSSI